MKGKFIILVIIVLFFVGFISPWTYWNLIHLARTIFILFIGVAIGYFMAKVSD